jgi:hypothetical protein
MHALRSVTSMKQPTLIHPSRTCNANDIPELQPQGDRRHLDRRRLLVASLVHSLHTYSHSA